VGIAHHSDLTMLTTTIEWGTLMSSALIQRLRYPTSLPATFNPQRILVIKLDHLGDVLLATPVFSNLRRSYPAAQIHALVGEWGEVVLRHHPDVDETIRYNAPFFCRSGQPTLPREAFRELRRRKYDLVIELRGDWTTARFALFKPAPYWFGRAALQLANRLGTAQFTEKHELERNLDVLRAAGIPAESKDVTFYPAPADAKWVDARFDTLEIDLTRSLIAIHPGSPVALKRWRPERFAALADWLISQRNAQILFVGVLSEQPLVMSIQKQMRGASINIVGETTVSQLAEILKRADLFIGNDSGPMHLAAAVGTRTIGLYGPGDPERFGPVGAHCQPLRRKPDCPPCMRTSCKFGGEGCMKEIGVVDVIERLSDK
jgi:heptosyltransferase III